jgi:hypothetical protein
VDRPPLTSTYSAKGMRSRYTLIFSAALLLFVFFVNFLVSLRVAQRADDYYFSHIRRTPGARPLLRRRFIPLLNPQPEDEPQCGAPAPRMPSCEAWCTASPFSRFAASLSATGRGCWLPEAPGTRIPAPRRVVLYTGYNGLADSLVGAVAAFYVAALTGAEFHMRFSGDAADPSFLWAYEPNCFDALSATWSAAVHAPYSGDDFSVLRTHYSFDVFHVPDHFLRTVKEGDLSELWAGNEVLSISSHFGFVHHLLKNPRYAGTLAAMGLTAQNAFAEAYHFLLRPRAAGLRRFHTELAALLDPATITIGIHVRTGVHYDKAFEPGAPSVSMTSFMPFFACAQRVDDALLKTANSTTPLRTQWFLISDSLSLREDAALRLPDKLLPRFKGIEVRHTRTSTMTTPVAVNSTCESFLDAALEHWLFGLADAHVVTQWSGFGRTGALLHVPFSPAVHKPMFQISATTLASKDCLPVFASPLKEILEHPPGI